MSSSGQETSGHLHHDIGDHVGRLVPSVSGIAQVSVYLPQLQHLHHMLHILRPTEEIGQRFPIDVLYLNREHVVVKAVRSLRAFRVSACLRGGHSVLELPTGAIDASGTRVGDRLVVTSQAKPQTAA